MNLFSFCTGCILRVGIVFVCFLNKKNNLIFFSTEGFTFFSFLVHVIITDHVTSDNTHASLKLKGKGPKKEEKSVIFYHDHQYFMFEQKHGKTNFTRI